MALTKSGMYKKYGHAYDFQYAPPSELVKRWDCPYCNKTHGLIGTMDHIDQAHKVVCVCIFCDNPTICYNPHMYLNHVQKYHKKEFAVWKHEQTLGLHQKKMLLMILGLGITNTDIWRTVWDHVIRASHPFLKKKGKWTSSREDRDKYIAQICWEKKRTMLS